MRKLYHFIGIVIFIVILIKIDMQKLFVHFSRINFPLFLLINMLLIPTLFLRVCRWKKLLQAQGIEYSLGNIFLAYLGGFYAGMVTPGRIGELIKIVYLKKDKNISYSESLASIFVDRLFDLYGLVLLVGLGITNLLINVKHVKVNTPIILIVFLIFFIPLLLRHSFLENTARLFYKSMFNNLDKYLLKGQLKNFLSAVKRIILSRIYAIPLILTILAFLIYFYQCYLLAHLASINISFITVMSFVAISSFISMLPVTFLGIGTRDASLIYLFGLVGLSAESAVTYSFLIFLSFYIISGLFGFIGWFFKERNIGFRIGK